ncbi:four-helix bundle copper-binding protein [Methyloversatilis thermotolerans]|uniref:four-helix bundle copper-binding protein n=1 Tax=Methyloversatilis thermotolerans TaxID=1346290 RepID=UPI00036CFE8F|nr:four-helix bundle copper-binding protein [Methyloversatilis thermotolerans]
MDRRNAIGAGIAASLGGLLLAGNAAAADGHEHHHHAQAKPGGPHKHAALLEGTTNCLRAGEICHAECLRVLATGDKDMAACAVTVSDMLATCDALLKLAAADSRHLPKMAALAAAVCDDCEKECRKHEKMHSECRQCAEACVECARACRKVAA